MPLFRALAKNMAPMTNADESPTNRLTLFPIYLSLFIVSTLCREGRQSTGSLVTRQTIGKTLHIYITLWLIYYFMVERSERVSLAILHNE